MRRQDNRRVTSSSSGRYGRDRSDYDDYDPYRRGNRRRVREDYREYDNYGNRYHHAPRRKVNYVDEHLTDSSYRRNVDGTLHGRLLSAMTGASVSSATSPKRERKSLFNKKRKEVRCGNKNVRYSPALVAGNYVNVRTGEEVTMSSDTASEV